MTDKEKNLAEILAEMERKRPEIDRIMFSYTPIIDTGRRTKNLRCIPNDADFTMKDGNTEYEVIGHFDDSANEYILNKIIRKLGQKYNDE